MMVSIRLNIKVQLRHLWIPILLQTLWVYSIEAHGRVHVGFADVTNCDLCNSNWRQNVALGDIFGAHFFTVENGIVGFLSSVFFSTSLLLFKHMSMTTIMFR